MTPQEWLRQNPNKGINDYYEWLSNNPKNQDTNTNSRFIISNPQHQTQVQIRQNLIPTILVGIIGIVAFFLPWVKIQILGYNILSVSGFRIQEFMTQTAKYGNFANYETYVYISYGILIGAISIILGGAIKSILLISFGQFVYIVSTVVTTVMIYQLAQIKINDLTIINPVDYGLYLSAFTVILIIIDMIR
ncbi:MAG: hypothetical protein AB8G11_13295 [Saprospiraceae bacterium]